MFLIENYLIIWLHAETKDSHNEFRKWSHKAGILRAVWLCSPIQRGCLSYFTLCRYCIVKSYQEPGEWIEPKKTVAWENPPTPPTWPKLNSNKFDPLTDFDFLDLVQLQRNVQFFAEKTD